MELLCIAAEADPTGYVLVNGRTPTTTDLARMTGEPEAVVQSALEELDRNGVFSRDRHGRIYSRRIVKDAKEFFEARKHGKEGGNPKLTAGYNKPGYVYLVGVRNDGAYKIGISVNPAKRLTKIRAQYPGQDLAVIDSVFVSDMGAHEATMHETFREKRSGEWFFLTELDIRKIREIFQPLKGREKGGENPQKPEARSQKPESEDPPISPPLAGGDAKAKTRRQAGQRIAPEWMPSAEGRSFAESLDLDPEWVGDEFRDYWLAESGPRAAKRDWDRAFKTRCRTLAEQGRGRKAGPETNGRRSPTPLLNQSEGFFRAAEKLIRDQGDCGSGEPFDEPLLDSGRTCDTAAGAGRGLARRLN